MRESCRYSRESVVGCRQRLIGQTYLANYGLPQFFFHVSTAYAILRHTGIATGKRDDRGLY